MVTTQSSPIRRAEPLAGAYFWLLAFFVVYCARPEDWVPGLHALPLAKITGIFALVALVLSLGQARRLPREMLFLFLLFAQLWLTVPFSPVWRFGAYNRMLDFSKVVVIVPVVVLAVSTLARLRGLIFTQTASVLAIAIVSLVKGQLLLGRLKGVLGGIYDNPNDLALAIVLTIPFCFAFMLSARGGFRKAAWFLATAVMTYVLLLTASRAGSVALLVALGVCLIEFGVRGRRYYLCVAAGLVVLVLLGSASGALRERFNGIFSDTPSSQEAMVAHGSFIKRREVLWKSLVITAEHPVLGVGPGNFLTISGVWQDPHNSYTQISSEGGVPALVLYLIILWLAFANVRRARRLPGATLEEQLLAGALRASLAGYLVGSFFSSVGYHFFPYFLVAYTSALYAIAAKQASHARLGQEIADTSLERAGSRHAELPWRGGHPGPADKGSAITWSDYQRGRAHNL